MFLLINLFDYIYCLELTRVLNDIRDETLSHKTNNIIKNLQKTPKYPNDGIKVSELYVDFFFLIFKMK